MLTITVEVFGSQFCTIDIIVIFGKLRDELRKHLIYVDSNDRAVTHSTATKYSRYNKYSRYSQ